MKKKILWLAVMLLLLIALAVLVLHTSFVKAKVLNYLKQQLAQAYNLSLSAESLDYNLFTLHVSLKRFTLKSLENSAHPAFFEADLAVLRLTTALILEKKIDLAALYLEKPVINIFVYPDHSFNIPAKLFQKPEEPSPPPILRHIIINNGSLFYHDPSKNVQAGLQGFHLEGALPEKGKKELILQLQEPGAGSFIFKDNTLRLDQVKITTRLDDRTAHVSLKGTYLKVNESFTFDGKVHWQQNRLSIPEFLFTLGEGEISGNGVYYSPSAAAAAAAPSQLFITWKNLNLQSPLLTNFFPHPVHASTSGSLDLSFPELSLKSIRGNATAAFLPLKTPPSQPGFIPLTGQIAVRLEAGKITIPTSNLFAQGNNIEGKLTVKNNSFQGEITGVLYNKPSIAGHIQLSGQFNPDLSNPTVVAHLESNGLRIGNIIEVLPKGTLKYENGRLISDDLLIQAKDEVLAQVTISGTVPVRNVPPGSPNPLDITIKGQDIPIEHLLSIFNIDDRAQGTLSLNAHILPKHYRADVQIAALKIDRSRFMAESQNKTPQWLDVGHLAGQFELVEDRLNYRIQAPELFMDIIGNGRISAPYPLEGQLSMDIPVLEKLTARLGLDFLDNIAGHINGQVNFQLDLATGLKDVTADAAITKLSLHSQGQDLENTEPIRFSFSPTGITVHKLELRGLGSEISGSGFLPGGSFEKPPPGPPQNFLLEKDSHGLTFLAHINPALLNLFIRSLQFNGQLTLHANISGSLAQPILSTELTLKELSVEKFPTQPITPTTPTIPTTPTQTGFRALVEGYIRTSGNVRNLKEFAAEAQFPVLELHLPGVTVLRALEPVKLRLENGRLKVQQMTLRDEADWSNFTVSGAADLTGIQPLDLTVTGQVDARLAGVFLEDFHFNGKNDLSLRIGGNLHKPEISGNMDMQNIEVSLPRENMYIDQVKGKILFMNNRIVVGPLTGKLNDGRLDLEGEIIPGMNGFQKIDIKLTTTRSHFELPKGLFSEVSSKLNFSFNGVNYLLKGTVEIADGVYKEPFNVLNKVIESLRSSPVQEAVAEGTFEQQLNLDIEVHTISPLFIDTNLSRSEISADITVGGTLARPTLSGRLMMKEGGEIYLGKNRFSVESGVINFVNPYRIDPELRIHARGKVNNYDIVLSITGTLSALSVNVSSTPPLPQPNIIGLLMGQRGAGSAVSAGTGIDSSSSFLAYAGSRAMGYLGNALSNSVEKLVRGKLGIESFRLDGSLIASKDNPGARITVGQHLTPKLELILSQSLTQAQNRTWILDYKPLPNFSVEARKQDRDNYSAALLAELLFGRKPKTGEISAQKRTKPLKIKDIEFNGNIGLPVSTIRKNLKLRKGKKFNFFKFHDDLERLRKLYMKHDFLRADIESERFEENGKVTIRYTINAGPRIYLDFLGTDLPRSFRGKACGLWCDGRFDLQSTRYVVREIYLQLYKKGYYQAQVISETPVAGNNFIRYPFTINTGVKYVNAHFVFKGNTQTPGKALSRFLKKMRLRPLTFYDPKQVVAELIQYYKERGFLEVRIDLPEIRYSPALKEAEVEFSIAEGPRVRIGQITFTGNHFLATDVLLKTLNLKKNNVFSPGKLNDLSYRIADAYAKKGFNDIRVTYTKQYVTGIGLMNLEFKVDENRRGVIREITITGNFLTRTSIIKRELTFKEGDTLDFDQVNKSRMKLYDLEIFQWVDIDVQPIDEGVAEEEKPGREKPFRLLIEVREIRPFRVKGGLQWDTEKDLGAVVEFSSPNTAGKAHYLGASFITDPKENGLKAYYRVPYFFKWKLPTEFFAFAGKKEELSYTISRKGLTLQQQFRYWQTVLFSFSYTWERDHVTKPGLNNAALPVLDTRFNLGYLTAALTYDRRNNIVNPTQGFFLSGSWLYARKYLGSQVNFYRFYVEGQLYLPVSHFLVIASSLRAGSGRGLGKEYLPGERFFAGGGNTLRGFKESIVGPLDANGNSLGGEALFLFNQEFRIRLSNMFIFVLFADLGNVYARSSEFDIFNIRKSAGFGVRRYTGPLLLRADIGFILNRRQGEPASRIILSIGQAF